MRAFLKSLRPLADATVTVLAFVGLVFAGAAVIIVPIAWATLLPSIGVLYLAGWLA